MKLKLINKKEEAPSVVSFILEPQAALSWKPGQFFHYVLHHEPSDPRGSDRWFTVASAPSEKHAMITTRLDAQGSSFKRALQAMPIGEMIEISDVDGDFTVDDPSRRYVFIAGGIGVTPFRSILTEADARGEKLDVILLYANRDEHIPYKSEFDAFAARNPQLKIRYFTGSRIDESAIRECVPDMAERLFYVSGPEPMVESFGKMLKDMGVSPDRLKQDWFPGYGENV